MPQGDSRRHKTYAGTASWTTSWKLLPSGRLRRPGVRLGRLQLELRQGVDGRCLVQKLRVGVSPQRQADVTVTHDGLGGSRGHARLGEMGCRGVSKGVSVDGPPPIIASGDATLLIAMSAAGGHEVAGRDHLEFHGHRRELRRSPYRCAHGIGGAVYGGWTRAGLEPTRCAHTVRNGPHPGWGGDESVGVTVPRGQRKGPVRSDRESADSLMIVAQSPVTVLTMRCCLRTVHVPALTTPRKARRQWRRNSW